MLKNKIIKFDFKIYIIEKYSIFALLILMLVLSTIQISLRIFFNNPIAEIEIVIREIVMIGCLLSSSLATYHSSHFRIEILDKMIEKSTHKKRIKIIGYFFIFISAVIIVIQSAKFIEIDLGFKNIIQEITELKFKSIHILLLPIIFINMAIHSIANIIKEE